MKLFNAKTTEENKSGKWRFRAFVLTLIVGMLPTITVLAKTINFYPGDQHIGEVVSSGDIFTNPNSEAGEGGGGYVDYEGEAPSTTGHYFDESNIKTVRGYSKWKVKKVTWNGPRWVNVLLSPYIASESDSDPGSSHRTHNPGSWEANPDELTVFYYKNGVLDGTAKFGKEEQGDGCKKAFADACPAGWTQAFTFSMSVNNQHTSDLKDGVLKLYVPPTYQKAGRKYAIMGIDRYGVVHIFNDNDLLDFVVTSKLNFEGYAFSLIYTD